MQCEFMLADVTKTILGNDFFLKHHYALNILGKQLINLKTLK